MHKKIALLALLVYLYVPLIAIENPKIIVKTNILNLLFIPSLHAEVALNQSSSLQFNFHRSKFVFISETELLNTSVEYKKYFFTNSNNMNGLYLGAGIHFNYNYKAYVGYDTVTGKNTLGAGAFGPIVRAGYQTKLGKSRFTLDIGLGAAYLAIPTRKNVDYGSIEYRAMLGIGYRLFKD